MLVQADFFFFNGLPKGLLTLTGITATGVPQTKYLILPPQPLFQYSAVCLREGGGGGSHDLWSIKKKLFTAQCLQDETAAKCVTYKTSE